MSAHTDIYGVLTGLAGGRVYWEVAPAEMIGSEYIVIREVGHRREMTLNGYAGITQSMFVFDCWSLNKLASLALAGQVETQMETLPLASPEEVGEDDFVLDPQELMVARKYSLWHS